MFPRTNVPPDKNARTCVTRTYFTRTIGVAPLYSCPVPRIPLVIISFPVSSIVFDSHIKTTQLKKLILQKLFGALKYLATPGSHYGGRRRWWGSSPSTDRLISLKYNTFLLVILYRVINSLSSISDMEILNLLVSCKCRLISPPVCTYGLPSMI